MQWRTCVRSASPVTSSCTALTRPLAEFVSLSATPVWRQPCDAFSLGSLPCRFWQDSPPSASADDLENCKQGEPDRRILACSQIITDGRTTAVARAEVYVHRGWAYMSKDDREHALADAAEAIRLDANSAKAFNLRGSVLRDKKEHDRAIAAFSEAIRLDPGLAVAYVNRSGAWDDKGELDRAMSDADEGIRPGPQERQGIQHARIPRGEETRVRSGDRGLHEGDEIDPKTAYQYHGRGGIYLRKGEYDRAIADLCEALRLSPNQPAVTSGEPAPTG